VTDTSAGPSLAEIWGDVLRLDRVDQDANFFDLGGDSVAAVRITSRAGRAGIPLTLADIFAHQTITAILAAIGARRPDPEPAPW